MRKTLIRIMKHKLLFVMLIALITIAALCSCNHNPVNNTVEQQHVINKEIETPKGRWVFAKENEAVYEFEIKDDLQHVVLKVAFYDSVHEVWPDDPIVYSGTINKTEYTRLDKNTPELLEETRLNVYELDFTDVENDNGMGPNVWDGAFEVDYKSNISYYHSGYGGYSAVANTDSIIAFRVSSYSNANSTGLVAVPEWRRGSVFNQWWKTSHSDLGWW